MILGQKRLLAIVALVSTLAVGCGSGIDRDAEIQTFIDATGLPRDQAACVVDMGIDRLGEKWMTSQAQVTREEAVVLVQIYEECRLNPE